MLQARERRVFAKKTVGTPYPWTLHPGRTEVWPLRPQSARIRWEDTPPPPRTPWEQTPSPPRTSFQHHVPPSPRSKDLYQQLQSKEPRVLDELSRQGRLGELSAHSNAAESTFMEALRQASRVREEVLRELPSNVQRGF